MITKFSTRKRNPQSLVATLAIVTIFGGPTASAQKTYGMSASTSYAISTSSASSQGKALTGSVPSGPATNEILHLTLHDAINRALRYNLGTIESGENATIARGQRLLALSHLLPQVSAGVTENVNQ